MLEKNFLRLFELNIGPEINVNLALLGKYSIFLVDPIIFYLFFSEIQSKK